MKRLVPFLSLPLLLHGCGQAGVAGQPVVAEEDALVVTVPDLCRTHEPDAYVSFPNFAPYPLEIDPFATQYFRSAELAPNYADAIFLGCGRFVVDLNIFYIPDAWLPLDAWPTGKRGAAISGSWSMPNNPEGCSSLVASVRIYAQANDEPDFKLIASRSVSGQWTTDPSGYRYCAQVGDPSFHAPWSNDVAANRYAISVRYGGAPRPVVVSVGPVP